MTLPKLGTCLALGNQTNFVLYDFHWYVPSGCLPPGQPSAVLVSFPISKRYISKLVSFRGPYTTPCLNSSFSPIFLPISFPLIVVPESPRTSTNGRSSRAIANGESSVITTLLLAKTAAVKRAKCAAIMTSSSGIADSQCGSSLCPRCVRLPRNETCGFREAMWEIDPIANSAIFAPTSPASW